jgi:hypothetical protein
MRSKPSERLRGARRIIAKPRISSGAAGLAIKSYLALHVEGGNDPKDAAALGDAAINYYASILKDAISFVPELAPLARHAIEVAEQNAEAEPTIIGFGEPEVRS